MYHISIYLGPKSLHRKPLKAHVVAALGTWTLKVAKIILWAPIWGLVTFLNPKKKGKGHHYQC